MLNPVAVASAISPATSPVHEYGAYCELVGELCMMAPRVALPPRLVEWLGCAADEAMVN